MDIHLTFINNSNDANNAQIVIFQGLAVGPGDDLPVACQVINDSLPGDRLAFRIEAAPAAHAQRVWIAASAQPRPGELFQVDPGAATRLSLAGLASADIVMTGGGAQPFAFALANAVRR